MALLLLQTRCLIQSEDIMNKLIAAFVATLFAGAVFAQTSATTTAPAAKADVKADAKAETKTDKAEAKANEKITKGDLVLTFGSDEWKESRNLGQNILPSSSKIYIRKSGL